MIHARPEIVRSGLACGSVLLGGLVVGLVPVEGQLMPLQNYVGDNMTGRDFSSNDAHGSVFYHAVLLNVNFTGANLTGADLHEATVSGTNFTNALLAGADLRNHGQFIAPGVTNIAISAAQLASAATVTGINLHGNDLVGYNLGGLNLAGADLGATDLSGTDLSFTNLSGASLASAQSIAAVNLSFANLAHANLQQAELGGANLNFASLTGADFTGARLSGADLRNGDGATAITAAQLRSAAFVNGLNLSGNSLAGFDLSGLNLRFTNLSAADVGLANFTGTDLGHANLSNSNPLTAISATQLRQAASVIAVNLAGNDLTGFDLSGLVFREGDTGVNLSSAILTGANFTGTDLAYAVLNNSNATTAITAAQLRSAGSILSANLGGNNLAGFDLSGLNLAHVNLNGANFVGANLSAANLQHADLRNSNAATAISASQLGSAASLQHANLSTNDLSGFNLSGVDLSFADLSLSNVAGANFTGAHLADANLRNPVAATAITAAQLRSAATLAGIILRGNNLAGFTLAGVDLSHAALAGAHYLPDGTLANAADRSLLNGANLNSANLTGADLRDADLTGTNFSSANLTGALLASAIVTAADFTGASLQNASLRGTAITAAQLRGASSLSGVNLIGNDLSGFDLGGLNLTQALLGPAFRLPNGTVHPADVTNLAGANLAHATLSSATLIGANLSLANLTGADLRNSDATTAITDEQLHSASAVSGVNLSGNDLSGFDLRSLNLANADLSSANLAGALFGQANLAGTDLRNSNRPTAITVAQLRSAASIAAANLSGNDLSGFDLNHVDLSAANLSAALLNGVNFTGSQLNNADLRSDHAATAVTAAQLAAAAGIEGVNLSGNDLSGFDLHGLHFSGANFYGASLAGANLAGADLSLADLRNSNVAAAISADQLRSATVSGADLSGNNLSGFDLAGAQLAEANLSLADVSLANFTGANLTGTDLRNPDAAKAITAAQLRSAAGITWAKLSGNNLAGYNLAGLDLSHVDFHDANLDHATLSTHLLRTANFAGASLAGASLGDATRTDGFVYEGRLNLSGGETTLHSLGVAQLGTVTTLAGGATLTALHGLALEAGDTLGGTGIVAGALTNAGSVSSAIAENLILRGGFTNSGTLHVAGSLSLEGDGTSTGQITLAGGSLGFRQGEFTVSNAATGLTGSGQVTFGWGSRTTLDYGLAGAPLTISQNWSFAGGEVVLPGATSLRLTDVMGLFSTEGANTQWHGWGPGIGRTPDLPTTLAPGGFLVWSGGSIRNTVTLEAGSSAGLGAFDPSSYTPIVRARGDGIYNATRIDGTLVNQTTALRFEAVSMPDMERGLLATDEYHANLPSSGSFLGEGTLRNEGTVYIDLSGTRLAEEGMRNGASWNPGIENSGTATLGGISDSIRRYQLGSGGQFNGPVTNSGNLTLFGDILVNSLTQTAGSTTVSQVFGQSRIMGDTLDIQGGSWSAPAGGYFYIRSFENAGTVSFGGPAVVYNWIENKAGGTVSIAGALDISPWFLSHNQGTIILDGPAAVLRNVGTNVIDNMWHWQGSDGYLNLSNLAAGTLDIRNGANATLNNGLAGPANLAVGNGSTLTLSNGTLSGPARVDILAGGSFNNTYGFWGGRTISNAGSFNATGAVNVAEGAALTFNNLTGGSVNISSSYQFVNAGANGSSVALMNAAGATISKVSGSAGFYDLIYGSGSVENHGLIEAQFGAGVLALKNLTNDGVLRVMLDAELWLTGGTLLAGTVLEGNGLYRVRDNTTTIGAGLDLSAARLYVESGTLAGEGRIVVGSGDFFRLKGGTLAGPGAFKVEQGGSAFNQGGLWGSRAISNAGLLSAISPITVAEGATLALDNLSGGVIDISSSYQLINAGANGSSVALTNAFGGTISKTAGVPGFFDLIYGSGTFVNAGLVEVKSDSGVLALKNLTNTGTLRAAAGTELWLNGGTLAGGTVLDGAGTFRFRENTVTLENGLALSAKDLWLEGGTLLGAGGITVRSGDTFRLSSGRLSGPGYLEIQSGGVMNNNGGFWDGWMVRNRGTLNANTPMVVADGATLHLENLTGGVINISSSYQLLNAGGAGQSASLINWSGATIRKTGGTADLDLIYGNGTFWNTGLVEVQSGTGGLTLKNLTNSGTLRAAAGTELRLNGGTLEAGTVLDGAGTFRFRENTTTLGEGYTLSAKDLWLDGATLQGAGGLMVRGGDTFRLTSGKIDGPGALAVRPGGAVINSGGGVWGGLTVNNAGDFIVTGAVNVDSGAGLVFNNQAGGLIRLTNSYQFVNASGSGASVALSNAAGATIRKSAGTVSYDLIYGSGSVVNHGLVEVQSGAGVLALKSLTNDGTLRAGAGTELWVTSGTLLAGTVMDGAGTYRFRDNTTTLDAGLTLSAKDLWLDNGVIAGAGGITVRNGDTFRMTGGTLSGPGAFNVASGGTVNSGDGRWGSLTVGNAGTFNALAAVVLSDGAALTFNNQAGGLVNLTNSYQFINAAASGRSVTLTNAVGATIRKAGGTNDYDLIYGTGTFVNHGTVEVNDGLLRAVVGLPGGQLTEGTWRVTDGARLILNNDDAIAQNAATVVLTGASALFNGLNRLTNNTGSLSLLGGRTFSTGAAFANSGTLVVGTGSSFSTSSTFTNTGTLNITGSFSAGGGLITTGTLGGSGTFLGSLTSGGILSPGNSPGLLTVTGNLTLQGTSTLVMELGGLVEGVSYDSIDVGGALALNGSLNVVLVNGFVPTSGATFNLFDAASLSGTFSSVSLPTLTNGLTWNTSQLATTGALSITGTAIPEPGTYAAFAGLGALGLALLRRRRTG